MAFLTDIDYDVQIRNWVKQIITQENEDVLHQAELAAQAEMESYLRGRYDVAEIFDQTGTERNALIVMYLVDMVVYHLHSNISPENTPEIRYIRYKAAINWLADVSRGKLTPQLPETKTEESEEDSLDFQGGSNPKVSERY